MLVKLNVYIWAGCTFKLLFHKLNLLRFLFITIMLKKKHIKIKMKDVSLSFVLALIFLEVLIILF